MMRTNILRRSICFVLALVLVLGAMPVSFARETQPAAKTITVDFVDFVEKASQQAFWDDFATVSTKQGNTLVKIGAAYQKSMDETQKAAYDQLLDWIDETYDWSINEDLSLFKASNGNRLYLSAKEGKDWALCHHVRFYDNAERSDLTLDITAKAEGWYRLDMDLFAQSTSYKDTVLDAGASFNDDAGGGYMDIYVNGEKVCDEVETKGSNVAKQMGLGAVYLEEGTNTLSLRTTASAIKSSVGTSYHGRCGIYLNSIRLVPLSGLTVEQYMTATLDLGTTWLPYGTVISADTHTVEVADEEIASACINAMGKLSVEGLAVGETELDIMEGDTVLCTIPVSVTDFSGSVNDLLDLPIVLDFMEFAQEAPKQEWWGDLRESNVPGVRYVGTSGVGEVFTETEAAAYEAMLSYMEDNQVWSIHEPETNLNKTYYGKRLFINTDPSFGYGLRFYTGELGDSARVGSDLTFKFTVPEGREGIYAMELETLLEATSTSIPNTSGAEGGGIGDIYVNDELVYTKYKFGGSPDNTVIADGMGQVYLTEGENTICIDMISDFKGTKSSARRAINLRSITFAPMFTWALDEGTELLMDLRDTYVTFDTDVSVFAVASSNEDAVQAAFDEDGNLLISAVAVGKANLTVADGDAVICTIPVEVTAPTGAYSDLSGGTIEVTEDGWYMPKVTYYASPEAGASSVYLDETYLGTVNMYDVARDLTAADLRMVYLTEGSYTLRVEAENASELQALYLTAIDTPEFTLRADDLADKAHRTMQTPIRAKWFTGLSDDLVDALWEVEVSDESLLTAEVVDAAVGTAPVLQVVGLRPGKGTVTVTASLGGVEASATVNVEVLQSAALAAMDVFIQGVDKGQIAKNTNQPISFAMIGEDADVIYPNEAEITYEVSPAGIVTVDEENHAIRGIENGDVTITITAQAGGVTRSDTLELTVADVGENRWSDRNSYFEEGTASWYGFREPTEDGFYAAVVEDDGTGNMAAKITINPAVSYNAGKGSNELSLANGQMAALEPGHIYEMTYRFKVDHYKRAEGAQNDPRMIVQVYDYDTNYRGAAPINQIYTSRGPDYANLTEGEWHTISLPVYAPIDTEDTIYAMPRITYDIHYASRSDGDLAGFEGTFWIDDIEIREVSFGHVEANLSETMTTITRPATLTLYPYTNTGEQIRLDAGILDGNARLETTNEDVVKVNGDMFIQEADFEYPSWEVQLVGLNAEAALEYTLTIGEETRSGFLDVTQTNLAESIRDVHYTLDGFDSVVLKRGDTALGNITGRTTQLTPITEEEFESVYFKSSDTSVATVNTVTGDLTCVGEGTATITAYGLWGGEAKQDTVIVTVMDHSDLASIALAPNVNYVAEGNSLQMYVEGTKASGGIADMSRYPVAWTIDEEAELAGVATITEDGRLYGKKAGSVTVTATIGVQRTAITSSVLIEVIPNENLPTGGNNFVFMYGGAFAENPTLEEHGYEIDYENCYLGGENLISSSFGYQQKVPNGGVFAMNIMVKKSGWYQLEVRGRSLYYLGNLNNVFLDNYYMGDVDFGSNVTSNYNGGGVLNTIYLEAGIHHFEMIACEGSRTQFLSRLALHPVGDPNSVEIAVVAEKTELVTGETVTVQTILTDANRNAYYLMQQKKAPEFTNYQILANSDPTVASFDGSTLTALTAGQTTITMTGELMDKAVMAELTITVKDASFVTADLTAERTTVSPTAEPFQLTLTTYGLGGVAQEAIPETVSVTYQSGNTAVVAVSDTGLVTITGAIGSAEITATLTEGERTVETTIWITVTNGKTEPTVFTFEERANAQENVMKYSWAWNEKEAAIKKANYYVEHLDQIYDQWIHEGIPRNTRVGKALDNTYCYCRYCGSDLISKYGHYPYIVDPIKNPWKITCPDCKRDFPSNDFGSFYQCGLDEQGKFTIERAMANGGEQYLVNELFPDKDPDWGVDNSLGYDTGLRDSAGVKIIHTYIAYYNACLFWGLGGPDEHSARDIFSALQKAYLYTGDEKYGNAGAILVDRLADVYPDYDLRQYAIYDYAEGDGDGGNGKFMGMIWEGIMIQTWAKAVDAFWPCMDNPEVVDYLKTKSSLKGLAPEDITPEYIRDHAEQDILMEIFEAVKTNQANGNTGMEEAGLAYAAVAIGHEPERSEMLSWLNAEDTQGGTAYTSYHTGAGLMRMLVEDVGREGICHEGSISYAALWDSNFLNLADALEGVEGFDLWQNQKFVNLYLGMMRLTVLGNQSPQTQETAGMYQAYSSGANVERMLTAFLATGNRDLARAIYARNGNSVDGLHGDIFTKDPESGVRSAIQKIVSEDGTWNMSESDLLSGYGIAILREGPESFYGTRNNGDRFSDYWMSFSWSNIAHTQLEALNIDVEAFGLTLSGGTMGYPMVVTGSNPNRMQWMRTTVSHNTVVVNDRGQDVMYENGFPLHFADDGKAKVIDIHAPEAYYETDIYRRTLVTVDNGDGVNYAVDFFRILGGSEHVYSFHAATRLEPTLTGLAMTEQPFGSYAGADIPFGPDTTKGDTLNSMNGYSWLYNVSRDNSPETVFSVDWQIEDYHKKLLTSNGIHLKLTMLSEEPMTEVALADGQPPQDGRYADHVEFMLVRRSGEPGMDTLFTTVIEPYQYDNYIDRYELVDITLVDGTENYNDRAAAVKTTLTSGRVDYIVYTTNPNCTYSIDGGRFTFRGFSGVCSYEEGILTYAWGNEVSSIADADKGEVIKALPAITGTVTDYTRGLSMDGYTVTVALDQIVSEKDLEGRYLYVNNDGTENAAYRIYGAEIAGNTAVLDLGTQTLAREMVNDADPGAGIIHNISVGDTYSIPLSASFDVENLFAYTTDKVVQAGSKLNITVGSAAAKTEGITYEAEGLATGMKFNSTNGTLTWSTSKTMIGRYPITVKAIDADGTVLGELSFTVYVVTYNASYYTPEKCAHAKTATYTVDNGDGTITTEVVCSNCLTVTKTTEEVEVEETEPIKFRAVSMNLGNELAMNIKVLKDAIPAGKTYIAKVTLGEEVMEIPMDQWQEDKSDYVIAVPMAARQMAEELTVVLVDETGAEASTTVTTGARKYLMSQLNKSTNAKFKTLVVDMLNYGAEAQKYFKYNTGDLANSQLTDAQKALASQSVVCSNNAKNEYGFGGCSLSLENRIEMNLILKADAVAGYKAADLYAEVSYTDYRGTAKTVTIDGSEFTVRAAGGYYAQLRALALADAYQVVTVKVYSKTDSSKTALVSGCDSIESYVARSKTAALADLNDAIMKVSTSARAYLLG